METKLDPAQQKAVEHCEGPALVVAGPGSGKTMVIIERILNLIRENNIKSYQILALAFNRKAANELKQRLSPRLGEIVLRSGYEKPEICTLHAFGRRIIISNYRKLNLKKEPSTWKAFKLEITIKEEVAKLNREKAHTKVTIYKISSKETGRCYYIGQTTNLQRRKEEHLADSSNPYLHQIILTEGTDSVTFTPIEKIDGMFADKREAEWIEHYKDLTVFNSEFENEAVEGEIVRDPVTIYKIESKVTRRCYVGYTTAPRWVEQNFKHIHNDALQEAIEDEGEEQFTFEVLQKEVPVAEIRRCIADEIETQRNNVVFNQSNPLNQRYADRLLIELFCKHFNICYEELLKRPSDIENFGDKIKDFEKIAGNIEKAKREVVLDFSDICSIDDISAAIIRSIDDLVVQGFAEKYEEKKKEANAIDFQDMIIYSTYLLETHPYTRKNYCEKYQYVHVDEFQDISFADFRLIKLLSENLFAVGDDDQAIYGFRGGDSEIMQNFRERNDVKKYKITRNYRSTSTIVEHSKILMEHNPNRISKNLHAKNTATCPPIKTLKIKTPETIENTFLREFSEPVCQIQFIDDRIPIFEKTMLKIDIDPQTIGILARYRSEVEKLRKLLNNRFKETEGVTQRKEGDPFSFIGRGPGEIIEGGTIHSAKGKEYDKVILIHNTLEDKDFPFHDSDDITEDRRVFYVAMTRAMRELVILGGECQFVSEAGLSTLPSKRKKQLEKIANKLQSAITKRIGIAKKEIIEASEKLKLTLTLALVKHIESAAESTWQQCEYELSRLRSNVKEAQKVARDTAIQLETELPIDLKAANNALLEELIPVLDTFESQFNNLQTTVESNEISDDFVAFTEDVQLAQAQLLNSLKDHGLKPIETSSGAIFNPVHHEELSPEIYSNGVPVGRIAKEEQCGYLLHDQVVRKAHVVISKRKQRADALLCHNFAQPVRFVTYAGFRDIRNIETFNGGVKGLNSHGKETQLQNLNVLFAFPKDDMASLKSHITKRPDIVNQNLQPIESISERFHIADDEFKPLLVKDNPMAYDNQDSTIQLVTRSGHVLNGHLWSFDEDFLYLRIKQKIVIVYRAGILRFKNLIWNEITKAYKNNASVNGHIIERSKSGLRVKFKSLIGFLPASQVELKTVRNLDLYVGKTLKMKVTTFSKTNNSIVFSRRAWLEESRRKLLNTFSEIPEELPKLKNIQPVNKTVEAIPGTNQSRYIPEVQQIPLDKSISVIISEPIADVIDTSPPIFTDLTESLNTYVKDLKPETPKTVEFQRAPLYKPIDLIVPKPIKKMVDSGLPTPKNPSEIPSSQMQTLVSGTLEIEITPNPLETVNSNVRSTLQRYEDILKEQIQEMKSEISEPENPDNVTQVPALETSVDRETPVESTVLTHPDSSIITDNNAHQIKEQDPSEEEPGNGKKSLGYYLRQGGRFAVEKIKVTIFRKPSS